MYMTEKTPFTATMVGGRGGLIFFGSLILVLLGTVLALAWRTYQHEQSLRTSRDQESLLYRENENLKAMVDKLQSQILRTDSTLRDQESMLREKDQSIQSAQSERERRTSDEARKIEDKRCRIEKMRAVFDETLKSFIDAKQIQVKVNGDNILVIIPNAALFRTGEIGLKQPEAGILLKAFLTAMKEGGSVQDILVTGHTDNAVPTGTMAQRFGTNWEIGAMRAASVLRYLVQNGPCPPFRIRAASCGDSRPCTTNDTPANREQNRRIEICIVLYPESLQK